MKKILVVDDNILMRKLIIKLFNREYMLIDEAADGQQGLDMVANADYDLVITDIIMPQVEGLEMIMHIRKDNPNMKIIAISGGKPYYLYMAKKLGIEAVFTKPLNQEKFYHAVKDILYLKNA
jgi:two-component system chemotaxis response regulator CheY